MVGLTEPAPPRDGGRNWSRETAAKVREAELQSQAAGVSRRQFALQSKVPEGTLRLWQRREESIDADTTLVRFFEGPVGLAFLHRLLVALHLVFHLSSPAGLRCIQRFLRLVGLDRFIGTSLGCQQHYATEMDEELHTYAQEQRTRLKQQMPPKEITLCEDETFRTEMCLVAMEPVSNFILVEEYATQRDAATWTDAVRRGTGDLPVEVVQSASDGAKGIIAHSETDLGAQHSPDVFHMQAEATKATSLALAAQSRRAEEALEKAKKKLVLAEGGSGAAVAQQQCQRAEQAVTAAKERAERAHTAIRGLSEAYHPFNLGDGGARSAEQVAAELEEHLDSVDTIVQEAGLSEKCRQHLEKARRVLPAMVATIAFVQAEIERKLSGLRLTTTQLTALRSYLLPSLYLTRCAGKAGTAAKRAGLKATADALRLSPPLVEALATLTPPLLIRCFEVAAECAEVFQRSSSCVEGRNGQLSLFEHAGRVLSRERLRSLTIIHNYYLRRPDGTTAAERFFGKAPDDLFTYLLEHLSPPPRAAKSRQQLPRTSGG